MTGRGVVIQGLLAAAGLAAAYTTWQRQPELSSGEVFAFDTSKGDLEKVRYEDTEIKSWAELGKDKDASGPFIVVRLSGSDASGIPMPAGHPSIPIKVPDRLVRGNGSADRLFERFAPLRATRSLGVLDAGRLKDLGLDASKKSIEITARGAKRRFTIAPAPPGGSEPYIRDQQDGRVYIVAQTILSDLQSAPTNLVERQLHSFKLEEVDQVIVTAGTKRKEWKGIRNPDLPGIALAPAATPDKPDGTAKNWHDRMWGLFPTEVLGKDEKPKDGAPAVALKIEYFSRGRPLGWTEVARAPVPAESAAGSASPNIGYGRSEFTLGWWKLSEEAFNLIADGEKLLATP